MGTSSNHPSPSTPTWQPLKVVLGNERVSLERQSAEVWRAALADRDGRLVNELGNEMVARAAAIADTAPDAASAISSFRTDVVASKSAGLILDMANRALARTCHLGGGGSRFAAELMAEAASYYVSRDLPSYVGAQGRVGTTSASIELKTQLRNIARTASERVGPPRTDPAGWRDHVIAVAEYLRRGGK